LTDTAALLRLADLFVGPSSAPMNLAVAGGTDAFGLFGSTPVLKYSKRIRAIVPPGGSSPDGMRQLLPAQALEQITPYLTREKARA
jgi:ADP-heptose:LPS heptosyltransferase